MSLIREAVRVFVCVFAIAQGGLPAAYAQTYSDIAAKTKASVAFLSVTRQCEGITFYDGRKKLNPQPRFGSCGSAFVINEKGHLVTNAHVVNPNVRLDILLNYSITLPNFKSRPEPKSRAFKRLVSVDADGEQRIKGKATILAVFHPGTKEEKCYVATTLYADYDKDLAVLRLDDKGAFVPLKLTDSLDVKEQQPVIAFGFPLGKDLANLKSAGSSSYPLLDTVDGRIRTVEVDSVTGKVERFRHSAEIAPGSSGGPLVNEQGEVIGVNCSGVGFAAINYAIPSNIVTELLRKWKVPFH